MSVRLNTTREVMQALLDGHRLVHNAYGESEDGEMYLYLSESGYICEEDGAGAKAHRVPLCGNLYDPGWRILAPSSASETAPASGSPSSGESK